MCIVAALGIALNILNLLKLHILLKNIKPSQLNTNNRAYYLLYCKKEKEYFSRYLQKKTPWFRMTWKGVKQWIFLRQSSSMFPSTIVNQSTKNMLLLDLLQKLPMILNQQWRNFTNFHSNRYPIFLKNPTDKIKIKNIILSLDSILIQSCLWIRAWNC